MFGTRVIFAVLEGMLLFLVNSCIHLNSEAATNANIKQETVFYDYLPESKIPMHKTCKLQAGAYELFAPPWKADSTGAKALGNVTESEDWVFVNFKNKPEGCSFWQGFVSAKSIDTSDVTDPADFEEPLPQYQDQEVGDSETSAENSAQRFAENFIAFYSDKANYDRVTKNVLNWYGEKREGCVAFASTALRFVGVPVPLTGLRNNDSISIVTKPFAEYLIEELGWKKIESLEDAQPGDIGVTVSLGEYVGYPTHVYVFEKWKNKEDLVAQVIDNQGFSHPRPLKKSALPEFADKDPTEYFIRPQ